MTRDEFFKTLEVRGKNKFEINYGQIRTKVNVVCPICYLCAAITGKVYSNNQFPAAARALGLEHGAMNDIVDAADNTYRAVWEYRKAMLKACGLDV